MPIIIWTRRPTSFTKITSLTPLEVKTLRLWMNMTQAQFAELCNVEAYTVWRWEHGVHHPIGKRARFLVAKYRQAKRFAPVFFEVAEQAAKQVEAENARHWAVGEGGPREGHGSPGAPGAV